MGLFGRKKEFELYAPVSGKVTRIENVQDPVFANKMMGDGIAVEYADGNVYSPISGVISATILPSGHAFGITGDNGIEVLVHVGLDTVNLHDGEFKQLKKQGERIEQGEMMIEVDSDKLKQLNLDTTTPMIITNISDFDIVKRTEGNVANGDVLLVCRKR